MKETLGQYVQRKRKEQELSQRKLAKRAGLSPNTVNKIEGDEVKPDSETLEKLADALRIPMSYLTDAMQGRMTPADKHPIVGILDELPPNAQTLIENIARLVAAEFKRLD
jgi:transcriptional regulator with XRE-family HTH domain